MKDLREKTLEQLENEVWGEPNHPSKLVITIHELRKKRLKDFTIEDLRITIGQNFSLDYLVPVAIEKLQENILAEGDMYEGDLLNSVLTVNSKFWLENKSYWATIHDLYRKNLSLFETEDNEHRPLIKAFEQFEAIHP
jgi:hypothetical protein